MYLGEYKIDDYVTLVATTHRFSSGAAYAPTSITYTVYEEATTTEIVTATAMTNFDAETGFYLNRIQCTTAIGYETGKTYTALIKATVDSVAAIDWRQWRVVTALPSDNYARIGAPAGASIAADLVVIDNFVDDLEGRVIGTLAAGTHNPQSGDAYARLGAPAGASVSADVAAVKSDTAAILADTGTDGVVVAAGSKTGYALADATSDTVIADAVWNAATASYGTAGTYGLLIETDLDATVSSRLATAGYTAPDNTSIAAILVDTGTDGVVVAAASKTGYALADATSDTVIADAVWNAATASYGTAGTYGEKLEAQDTGAVTVSAIGAGAITAAAIATDAIDGDAIAASAVTEIQSGLATSANQTTIIGYVDGIETTLGTPAGASVSADIAAVQADTNNIQTRIPSALIAVDVTFSAGGSTTTAVLNLVDGSTASSTNDVYNGRVLVFTAPAALKYQATDITDYVGSTKTATITAVTSAPDATATAILL